MERNAVRLSGTGSYYCVSVLVVSAGDFSGFSPEAVQQVFRADLCHPPSHLYLRQNPPFAPATLRSFILDSKTFQKNFGIQIAAIASHLAMRALLQPVSNVLRVSLLLLLFLICPASALSCSIAGLATGFLPTGERLYDNYKITASARSNDLYTATCLSGPEPSAAPSSACGWTTAKLEQSDNA